MLTTMKLVYKNMVWNRPKVGLYGLIALALISTTNLYFSLFRFGQATANVLAIVALSSWFVGLPMIIAMVDLKMNPKRVEKVLATLKQ